MKNKIMNQIELLVEMSGTGNTYETILEELNSLDIEIDGLKHTLKRLKKENSVDDYFMQNERVIDENIKLGVENRLRNLKDELNEVEENIKKYTIKEESFHKEIETLKSDKDHLEEFILSIDNKVKTLTNDNSTYSFYDEMLTKAYNDKDELINKIDNKEESYHELLKEMKDLGEKQACIVKKIEENNKELEKVSSSLLNKLSYEDTKRKKQDEALIDEYTANLEALETHKLNLLQDPAYLAHEANDYLLDNAPEKALKVVKELVNIVLNVPYMSVSLSTVLELLKEKEKERDEFALVIDKRNYETTKPIAIVLRINLLKDEITSITNEVNDYKKAIKNIDEKKIPKLLSMIEKIRNSKKILEDQIATYQSILTKNQEYKTPKKQAMLKSALVKKGQDLDITIDIYNKFMRELEDLVIESKNIETKKINPLNVKKDSLNKELQDLEKNNILRENTIDILEMQKDKDELKALNDETEKLKERSKYKKSANEIYDEIEVLLGVTDEKDVPVKRETLDDYHLDNTLEEESKTLVNDSIPDEVSITMPSDILDKDEEEIKSYPPREPKNNEELLKVISIEPLEEKEEKPKKEEIKEDEKIDFENLDDFMINDFSSDDYISFNDLLSEEKKDEMQ